MLLCKFTFVWLHLVLIPTNSFLEFQIPIRWPESRDEVWKANIPHTHLAQEKSDQNWMVVNGDKINFPGGGTHFHDGADKYIVALSRVHNLDSVLDSFLYLFNNIRGRVISSLDLVEFSF